MLQEVMSPTAVQMLLEAEITPGREWLSEMVPLVTQEDAQYALFNNGDLMKECQFIIGTSQASSSEQSQE